MSLYHTPINPNEVRIEGGGTEWLTEPGYQEKIWQTGICGIYFGHDLVIGSRSVWTRGEEKYESYYTYWVENKTLYRKHKNEIDALIDKHIKQGQKNTRKVNRVMEDF